MTEEIALKGIDLLKRNVQDDEISIVFYEGKPLLRFKTIKHTIDYAESLDLVANYVMITNGSIINDEIAEILKNKNFEIGISVDGNKKTHDEMRFDKCGMGTYDGISNTIEILKNHGITPGISCTLSHHIMNNPLEIKEYLEKYNLPCVSYNLPAINVNIVIEDSERDLLVRNLMYAETDLINSGILEDKVVDRRLLAFIEKHIWIRDCAAYGQQVVIMPKGNIGICHGLWPDKENSIIKTYFDIDYDGILSEQPTWKEWSMLTTFNMPSCWNCAAISLCGGGCAKHPLIKCDSIWETDKDICILMKEVIPWIIWTYYDKIQSDNVSV